jgi:hypothetical protein
MSWLAASFCPRIATVPSRKFSKFLFPTPVADASRRS